MWASSSPQNRRLYSAITRRIQAALYTLEAEVSREPSLSEPKVKEGKLLAAIFRGRVLVRASGDWARSPKITRSPLQAFLVCIGGGISNSAVAMICGTMSS